MDFIVNYDRLNTLYARFYCKYYLISTLSEMGLFCSSACAELEYEQGINDMNYGAQERRIGQMEMNMGQMDRQQGWMLEQKGRMEMANGNYAQGMRDMQMGQAEINRGNN